MIGIFVCPTCDNPVPIVPDRCADCGHLALIHDLNSKVQRTRCAVSDGPQCTPCPCAGYQKLPASAGGPTDITGSAQGGAPGVSAGFVEGRPGPDRAVKAEQVPDGTGGAP